MAENKEALPVVAWSYVPSDVWVDVVYTDEPEKVKLARECGREVTQLTDHATATAAIAELRADVDRLRSDAELLDWMGRAGPTSFGVVIDAPHDGDYYVSPDDTPTGYGKTFRAAIAAARAGAAGGEG